MESLKKMKLCSLLVIIWALQGFPNKMPANMDQAGLTVVRAGSSKHHNVSESWRFPELNDTGTENHTVFKNWTLPTSNETVLDQLSEKLRTLKHALASGMQSGHMVTRPSVPAVSRSTTAATLPCPGDVFQHDPQKHRNPPSSSKHAATANALSSLRNTATSDSTNQIVWKTLFIKFLDLNMSEVHTLKIIDGPVSHSVNTSAITRPIMVKNDAYSIVFRSAKATKHPIKGWRALVYTESTTDAEVKHCTSNPATVSCTPTP
ncbi:hypothetical protein Bbelb_016630 [Branchiostoma belcheri]|nr:hypothetical protein Bbelb_016630 [Branchiostoma belcheri]